MMTISELSYGPTDLHHHDRSYPGRLEWVYMSFEMVIPPSDVELPGGLTGMGSRSTWRITYDEHLFREAPVSR